MVILNSNNISQSYCFHPICNQINADFQNIKNLTNLTVVYSIRQSCIIISHIKNLPVKYSKFDAFTH